MLVYLDNCCYNRPFDDVSREKIHFESEAVLAIIGMRKRNDYEIIGSPALDFEIERIGDFVKREKVRNFYEQTISKKVNYNNDVLRLAKELCEYTGIKTLDSFHLSFAVNFNVGVLLTTDNKFEKAALKLNMKTRVINPLKYLMEVI